VCENSCPRCLGRIGNLALLLKDLLFLILVVLTHSRPYIQELAGLKLRVHGAYNGALTEAEWQPEVNIWAQFDLTMRRRIFRHTLDSLGIEAEQLSIRLGVWCQCSAHLGKMHCSSSFLPSFHRRTLFF
jgi:hypothetical protein